MRLPAWAAAADLALAVGTRGAYVGITSIPGSTMRLATLLLRSFRRRVARTFLTAIAAGGVASPLTAQVIIRGMVVDDSTGKGIPLTEVTLLTHYMDPLARVRTDSAGQFYFGERSVGWYRLQARRIGFAEVTTAPVEMKVEKPVTLQIYMRARSALLAPLVVIHQRPQPRDYIEDFEFRRARRVAGPFWGPQDLERMGGMYAPDLVRRVPGGQIIPNGSNVPSVYFGRDSYGQFGGLKCNPVFYLDGLRLTSDRERALLTQRLSRNLGDSAAAAADTAFVRSETNVPLEITMLAVSDIYGVEVYRGASQVPMEFADPYATCGVMVFWTKYGRR